MAHTDTKESKAARGDEGGTSIDGVVMGGMNVHTGEFNLGDNAIVSGNINVYKEADIKYWLICDYSNNGSGAIEAISVSGPSIVSTDHTTISVKSETTSTLFGSFKWNSSFFSQGSPINIRVNDNDSVEVFCKNDYFTVNGVGMSGKRVVVREGDIFSPAPNLIVKFERKDCPVCIEGTISPVNPEDEIEDSLVYRHGCNSGRYYNGMSERLIAEYEARGVKVRRITVESESEANEEIAKAILRVNNIPLPRKIIRGLKDA